jgi:hypothetical protein
VIGAGRWFARQLIPGHHGDMAGALIMAVILVFVIPIGFLITTGIVAALLGQTVKSDVDRRFEGTEHLEIS